MLTFDYFKAKLPSIYASLVTLARQGIILRNDMAMIVADYIAKILVDINLRLDCGNSGLTMKMSRQCISQDDVDPKFVAFPVDTAYSQAEHWRVWKRGGLANYSAIQPPNIWEVKELDPQISIDDRPNLVAQADGQTTAQDLAIGLNQDPLWVTQSITPYGCRKLIRWLNRRCQTVQVFFSKYLPGIPVEPIRWVKVEDRRVLIQPITPITSPAPQIASVAPPAKRVQPQPTAPQVAYVSASKLDEQFMGKVLNHLGYQFISIQNPMQVLPCLLEHKPDLIFLDLHLSIANGHEFCSQIRRVSIFRDTPVIILTHCDNFVDRIRAKVVGSTDFLVKPMGLERVQAILQQHLSAQSCLP